MAESTVKSQKKSQFVWTRKYRVKSLPFADKIPLIRNLIINNIPSSILKKIYVFGSYAYGQPTKHSDIDICIIIKNGFDIMKAYKMIHIPFGNNQLDHSDVLIYEEKMFDNRHNPDSFESDIAKKGILIYG